MVGGIPIAVRHIESVIRMSEAHAKLHLRENVNLSDIDNAIEMLLESFLQSQKVSVSRQLSKKFEKFKTSKSDPSQLLSYILKKSMQQRVSTKLIISFDLYLFRATSCASPKALGMTSRSR